MSWEVRLLREVEAWVLALDDPSYELVAAAIDLLEHEGPVLGRPLVDRIEGSRHHNMKELRPGSAGWYDRNIPVADERYEAWLHGERHR